MSQPDFIVWVCPTCKRISAYGKVGDVEGQLRAEPFCHGSEARPFSGSHEPEAMIPVEVVRLA